jgi:hypothetical protein
VDPKESSESKLPEQQAAQEPAPEAAVKQEQTEEEYEEYELSLFEGANLTKEDLEEIAAEASRLNLSKEDAEKLLHLKDSAYKKALQTKEQEYKDKILKARSEIENDPEFIGDKKEQAFASITRAVKQFGDPDLIALLNTPEVGNNIVIARFLKRLGDAISPDSLPGKGVINNAAPKGDETLRKLYPDFYK